ncbi:MAG: hypothetical protein LBK59_00060 [Bifidobacteriaceae bacterium]|jgi:Xaa-Pro aminopeptidase|nr:hypothetical protein [Bifidobacteriaceae bacterium]
MDPLTIYLSALLVAVGASTGQALGSGVSAGLKALVGKVRAHFATDPDLEAELRAAQESKNPQDVESLIKAARRYDAYLNEAVRASREELTAWYEARTTVQATVKQKAKAGDGGIAFNISGHGNSVDNHRP